MNARVGQEDARRCRLRQIQGRRGNRKFVDLAQIVWRTKPFPAPLTWLW